MDAPSRRHPLRRWLLPLLAALAAAGLLGWLTHVGEPAPLLSFETELYLSRSWAGEKQIHLKTSLGDPAQLALKDLETGAERDVPLPELPKGYAVSGVGRTLFWAMRPVLPDQRPGPVFAHDLATGELLFTDTPLRRWECHFGERLIVAEVQNGPPSLRFQNWNPRTGKREVDRLLPLTADKRPQVRRIRVSPDGRAVAVGLWLKPPPSDRYSTLVLDAANGDLLARRADFELVEQPWSADGAELVGSHARGPEAWAQRWDWRANRIVGELLLQAAPSETGGREAYAWLPHSGAWLVHDYRQGWAHRFPKTDEWLRIAGIRLPGQTAFRLLAVDAATSQERVVVPSLQSMSGTLLNSGRWFLHDDHQPTPPNRYVLYATDGSYPWPWWLRLALIAAAALAGFLLARRLLRPRVAFA